MDDIVTLLGWVQGGPGKERAALLGRYNLQQMKDKYMKNSTQKEGGDEVVALTNKALFVARGRTYGDMGKRLLLFVWDEDGGKRVTLLTMSNTIVLHPSIHEDGILHMGAEVKGGGVRDTEDMKDLNEWQRRIVIKNLEGEKHKRNRKKKKHHKKPKGDTQPPGGDAKKKRKRNRKKPKGGQPA